MAEINGNKKRLGEVRDDWMDDGNGDQKEKWKDNFLHEEVSKK